MNPGFWQGKSVLITGHTGFKGSWMSLWLQDLGAKLSGYALNPPTKPCLYELADIDANMTSMISDVRDLSALEACVNQIKPEIVFHLAAQPLVRYSYEQPVETYATNVMGTVNLLDVVRRIPSVRVVVVITSDKCYDNKESMQAYREEDPMGGYDPYSNSKGCAELVVSAYRNSYFNPADADNKLALASVRAGNVIGGGDWAADRLMTDVMTAFVENQPVKIRNPNAVRPWQHVLEPLNGYLMLAERLWNEGGRWAEAWNFGPNYADTVTVADIMERLAHFWGETAHYNIDDGNHPHEAGLLRLDSTKVRSRLGWEPLMTLDDALEWVVEWYQAYQRGEDMRQLSLEQIHRFQSKSKR